MEQKHMEAALCGVVVLLVGGIAKAQHQGDVWIGRSSDGKLKISRSGYVPEDNYFTLTEVNGPILWGWAGNSPGFDRITTADPGNDLFLLEAGAEVWLEVVSVDAAFRVIDGAFNILNTPGDETYLGDHTLHVHNTWNIDSTSPLFDPEQCVWQATFILRDKGVTQYEASDLLVFNGFTTVDLQSLSGDFDDDGDVDLDDYEAFAVCENGPGMLPMPDDPGVTTCVVDCLNAFDFDGDRDVDLQDFAVFQTEFDG